MRALRMRPTFGTAKKNAAWAGVCDDIQMPRKDYGEYRDAVRRMVNEVDPMALIAGGAPDDEYDPEMSELLKWRRAVTSEQVHATFEKWFDMPISDDAAIRIAEGIARVREEFGYTED